MNNPASTLVPGALDFAPYLLSPIQKTGRDAWRVR
jgi:hypothetical protein